MSDTKDRFQDPTKAPGASIYRAYRLPYAWVPQLDKPVEISITPPDNNHFQVPGSFAPGDPEAFAVKVDLA